MARTDNPLRRLFRRLWEHIAPKARTEDTLRLDLANAYATQSQSDFRVYLKLYADPKIEECHSLHYLQMACEEIAKAYRMRDMNAHLDDEMTSHVAFSKFIANLLRAPKIKKQYASQVENFTHFITFGKRMAREVERLAPAVDRNNSPANTEYPWRKDSNIVIPCRFRYPILTELTQPDGKMFLEIIQTAIEKFSTIHVS